MKIITLLTFVFIFIVSCKSPSDTSTTDYSYIELIEFNLSINDTVTSSDTIILSYAYNISDYDFLSEREYTILYHLQTGENGGGATWNYKDEDNAPYFINNRFGEITDTLSFINRNWDIDSLPRPFDLTVQITDLDRNAYATLRIPVQ